MALATLSIDLVAKLASLEAGLDKATRLNAKAAAEIDAKWKSLSAGATALGAAIGGAFSVTAITQFTRATIDQIDALNDAKDATGSTIENLSALEDVARRNGGTMDEVTGILVKFNGVLKEADGKNGVSQALKAIGLDAAELKQIDPAEALRQTAVALSEFADDGNKARIVQELFGKSIKDAAPFLKDLAEQGRLNATVTTEQADAAEKFNKQIFGLQTNINGAARSIVSDMIPALLNLTGRLNEASKAFGGFFSGFAGALFGPAQFKNLTSVREEIGRLEKSMAAYQGGNGALGEWSVNKAKENLAYLKQLEAYYVAVVKMQNTNTGQDDPAELARRGRGVPTIPGLPDFSGGTSGGKTAGKKEEPLGAIRDAKNQYLVDFLRSEKDAYNIKLPESLMGPEIPADLAAGRAELAEQNKQLAESIKSLYESTPEGAADRLRKTLEAIKDFQPQNDEQAAQKASAIKVLEADLKQLEETGVDVGATLQQALGDGLYDVLSGNFDNIGERWKNMLANMIADAAAADLMNLLTGKGSGGNTAALFSNFASFFASIPGFASGGDHMGGLRVVGERGPELEFTGPSRIMNAAQTQRVMRGGSSAPIYNINVAAGVGKAEVYEAVQKGIQIGRADTRQLLKSAGAY